MTKTKKKIIAGATLGVVAGVGFVGANASADEVTATTDNTATNLVTTQPVATPENTNAAANAGTETGEIVTPVESTGLNEAVNAAENAGVVVEETPIETVETIEEADTSLQKQEDKVEEATETAKEISKATTESENKANSAGVELKEESKVTYKDDTKKAIIDASEQAAKLETATNVQNEINSNLPKAQDKAREAGVTVTVADQVKYEDAQKALADLNAQVAKLEASATAQSDIDSALALAVASARKSGLNVELSANATFKDVRTALKAKDAELQKLVDAEQAQINANKTISDAAANAQAQGTVVKNAGTETVSVDQAEERAQEIAKRITEIVTTNKGISEVNARKQAEYEVEIERIEEENRRIDLRNVEIRLENSRKKAVHEKALADLKEEQENVENQNTVIRAENTRKKAEYEKTLEEANTNNEATAERNQEIEAENARKKAEYEAKLAEAQANTTKDGYASEIAIQDLIFKKEPNATASISGQYANLSIESTNGDDKKGNVFYLNSNNFKQSDFVSNPVLSETINEGASLGDSYKILMKTGETTTVTYTNLQNSTFNGKKISKIVYEYTPLRSNNEEGLVTAYIFKDPTNTIKVGSQLKEGELSIKFNALFFYEDGTQVNFDEGSALVSLSSLNASDKVLDSSDNQNAQSIYYEFVKDYNGNFIKITGSSVDEHGNSVYSTTNNSAIAETWDKPDSTTAYYGAGIMKLSGNHVSLTFGSTHDLNQWFAFNSNVKTTTVTPPRLERATPIPPVNVTPPTYEEELPPVEREITPPTYENEIPPVEDNTTPPTLEELLEAEMKNLVVATNVTPVTIETDTHKITMVVPVHDVEVATTVNPVQVKQTPSNSKAVNNAEGVNVDKQLVAKSSTIKWVLSNEALKSGRDYTVSYVLTDPLPKGFELNLLATAEATPDYNVKYDSATHTVTFIAKDATIFNLNADVANAEVVPVATIVGTVLNDGATYQNTFTTTVTSAETIIVDKNGKTVPNGKTTTYKVTSNTPEVYTPGSNTRTYNGNVVVRYFTEKDGKAIKIAPNQVDLEDAKVGSKYDTTDQKAETIAFEGKTYKLTPKVVGSETGDVIRGTVYVDYYYEVVPEVEGQGNVIVHYHDEDGNTISNDVVDTPNSPIGTDYTTTDNKPNKIVTEDGIEYELIPDKTVGEEDGKVTQGTTEVTYIYKRITPKPETPTPFDNIIEPSKHIYTKDGQQVDGKTLLPNTEVAYTAVFDLDQFKGMTATAEDIAKGIAFFDDLQDNTVSINVDGIVNKLADGTVVTELVATQYNSVSEAPEALQAIIEKSGISLDRQFIAWVPVNPTEFYNKYIVTGQSIYHTMPITVGDYVGTFQNKVWQVVFGNGYEGNIVENNIPKLEVLKDAVKSVGSNESIADGTVELGQTFPYVLDGPAIQANIVGGLQSYVFIDDFDEEHDEYNGEFYAFADQDIKLKDGTVIKAGDEITRYFIQNIIRNEEGVAESVTLSVDPTFLSSIAEDGIFDPKVYLLATRIAYAENVENTVKVSVNGYEVTSNTVVTHTPEPKEPETPETPKDPEKPVTTTPVKPTTPVAPASVLPSTGDNVGNLASVLGMALLSILGLFGLKKRKED